MSQTLMAQRTQPWGLQPCSATAAAGLAVGVEALPPEEVLLPNQEAHKISGMKQRRAPPERGRPLGPDGPPAPLAPSLPSRGRERATLFQNSEVRRYPGTGRCITRSSLSDQLAFWRAGSGARAETRALMEREGIQCVAVGSVGQRRHRVRGIGSDAAMGLLSSPTRVGMASQAPPPASQWQQPAATAPRHTPRRCAVQAG